MAGLPAARVAHAMLGRLRTMGPHRAGSPARRRAARGADRRARRAGAGRRPYRASAVAIMVVLAVAIAIRRRWPVVSALVGLPLFVAFSALGPTYLAHMVAPFFAMLFLLYTFGRNVEGRTLAAILAYAVVCGLISQSIDAYDDEATSYVVSVGAIVFGAGRWSAACCATAPRSTGRCARRRAGSSATARTAAPPRRGGAHADRRRAPRRRRARAQRDGRAGVGARAGSPTATRRARASAFAGGRDDRPRGADRAARGCSACCAARTRSSRSRRSRQLRHVARARAQASSAPGLPVELVVEGDERDAAGRARPDRLPRGAGGARRRAASTAAAAPGVRVRYARRARGARGPRRRPRRGGAPAARHPRAGRARRRRAARRRAPRRRPRRARPAAARRCGVRRLLRASGAPHRAHVDRLDRAARSSPSAMAASRTVDRTPQGPAGCDPVAVALRGPRVAPARPLAAGGRDRSRSRTLWALFLTRARAASSPLVAVLV